MNEGQTKVALEALRQAMLNEQETYEFYVKAAERVVNEKGRAMFRELAQEETVHIKIVRDQTESLRAGEGWTASVDFENLGGVDITPLEHKRSKMSTEIDDDITDLGALVIAAEMENNSFNFYVEQYQKTEDPVGKRVYGYLINAERNHFDTVMANWEHLEKTGSW